ncbi:MAG: hypothetical protein Q8Q41_03170 [bacterium]|nr:hypothetical protein [bacterium]
MRKALWGIAILLGFATAGCAPLLRVDESGSQVSGRWVNPRTDPLLAYDKVERGKTTLAELKALGFDPDAQVVGGTPEPKDKKEEKKLKEKLAGSNFKKPITLDGPEAFKLYMQMLFPEGSSTQAVTDDAIAKRQTEVNQYTAHIFTMEDIQDKKDRVYFSTFNKIKIGFSNVFKFILKNLTVIEKSKKEEEFNDPKTEKSFGKGAIEVLKGIREIIPAIIP